jgi:hypothetical protein
MCSTLTCLTINVPHMYGLSFYLNNVLNVSLRKPVVFQLFANCCHFTVNKRVLLCKPYKFE